MTMQFLDNIQEIDLAKENLAKKYNFEFIRIDARISDFNYIKASVLTSFSNIFNFDSFGWHSVETNSLNSIIKEVCKEYEIYKSIKIVSEKFNISRPIVVKYLKKGNMLGWCTYILEVHKRTAPKVG